MIFTRRITVNDHAKDFSVTNISSKHPQLHPFTKTSPASSIYQNIPSFIHLPKHPQLHSFTKIFPNFIHYLPKHPQIHAFTKTSPASYIYQNIPSFIHLPTHPRFYPFTNTSPASSIVLPRFYKSYIMCLICFRNIQWHRVSRRRAKCSAWSQELFHDDVIKWKHFPRNWPFVRGIHWSPVNSPHKGQWRGALMFSLICVWINDWVNNREAGDLRRYLVHYDVIVMYSIVMLVYKEFN